MRLQPIHTNELYWQNHNLEEIITNSKQNMQQMIYLLNSLEVTDSSRIERTERGGVSKSGFNHSES